jgi:predicted ATPase
MSAAIGSATRARGSLSMWDDVHIKALLRLPRFPLRLLEEEPWVSWIAQHGGAAAVRGHLRAATLAAPHRRVLELIMARPTKSATLYADALDIGLSTYFKYLHELMPLLVAHLDRWQPPELDQREDLPSVPGSRPVPTNVAAPLTSLVGAETEALIAQVITLLERDAVRLITLGGPGGVGKSRLATQVARLLLAAPAGQQPVFPHGIYFVDLAVVHDPALVPVQLAKTLQLTERGETPLASLLAQFFEPRRLLLVVDNFEHVLEAAALVSQLLSAAPRLKVLVTSRAPLNIYGEHKVVVPPLALPDRAVPLPPDALLGYSAVRLFVERAAAANAGFALTPANSASVAQICAHLDGLPLAIELAAARCATLPPELLLALLQQRQAILSQGPRDRPARHQSVRNTIDWSYQLLVPEDQQLFVRMAVFVGGWQLEAAEAVCGDDVLEGMASLLDKSMIQRADGVSGEPRFSLLETIREYALEHLAHDQTRERVYASHARYFLELAEHAEHDFAGSHQGESLAQLRQEHDNLRAALRWSLATHEAELAIRLVAALWKFWRLRGHSHEGRRWAEAALALAPQPSPAAAVALCGAGWLAYDEGDHAAAELYYQRSLALAQACGDERAAAMALQGLGQMARMRGEQDQALRCYEQSVAILRRLGDSEELAWALDHAGRLAFYQGEYERARSLMAEAIQLFRALGHRWGLSYALGNLGHSVLEQGDVAAALPLLEESLQLQQELGDRRGSALFLNTLGEALLHAGQHARARELFARGLAEGKELGYGWAQALSLRNLGRASLEQLDYHAAERELDASIRLLHPLEEPWALPPALEHLAAHALACDEALRAARLCAAAAAMRQSARTPLPPLHAAWVGALVEAARGALDSATFAQAWASAGALSREQVIREALRLD